MPARHRAALAAVTAMMIATPLLAQPGGMMRPGWGAPAAEWPNRRTNAGPDSREGKVDADSFVADDAAAALGHGAITVTTLAGSTAGNSDQAAYEAAIVDQLVKAGYETARPDPDSGQVAEIRIVRDTLVPEEARRKPVSGEMDVGVSNRGSSVGLAVAVDLSKPRKALISTRLEARLRDRATGKALWEGHATIATREGDDHWSEQAIASRLAAALFAHFPDGSSGTVARR